jgi:hypothetical protein
MQNAIIYGLCLTSSHGSIPGILTFIITAFESSPG